MKKCWEDMTEAEKFRETFRTLVHRPGAEDLLEELDWLGFFSAPASSRFHGSYSGGLVAHSNNVFRRLVMLAAEEERRAGSRAAYSAETLAIVALLHDVCKSRAYQRSGNGFVVNERDLPIGHGEKSLFIIMRYMNLSEEEALAIRWHMGAYDKAAQSGFRDLDAAMRKSSLVLLLHLADMQATHIDENGFVMLMAGAGGEAAQYADQPVLAPGV